MLFRYSRKLNVSPSRRMCSAFPRQDCPFFKPPASRLGSAASKAHANHRPTDSTGLATLPACVAFGRRACHFHVKRGLEPASPPNWEDGRCSRLPYQSQRPASQCGTEEKLDNVLLRHTPHHWRLPSTRVPHHARASPRARASSQHVKVQPHHVSSDAALRASEPA